MSGNQARVVRGVALMGMLTVGACLGAFVAVKEIFRSPPEVGSSRVSMEVRTQLGDEELVVGGVVATTIPSPLGPAWSVCDGRLLKVGEYPDLYDVIGRGFSEAEVSPEQFRIPNYRGMRIPGGGLLSGTFASVVVRGPGAGALPLEEVTPEIVWVIRLR